MRIAQSVAEGDEDARISRVDRVATRQMKTFSTNCMNIPHSYSFHPLDHPTIIGYGLGLRFAPGRADICSGAP